MQASIDVSLLQIVRREDAHAVWQQMDNRSGAPAAPEPAKAAEPTAAPAVVPPKA